MKKLKLLLVLVLSIFMLVPIVRAEDESPVVEITHDQQNIVDENGNLIGVELTLNLKATDVVAIQHDIEFDNDKLVLKDITPNGSFTATSGDIKEKKNKSSFTVVVDGEYAYSEAPYLKLYFEFTDEFVPNTGANIRFTNVKAAGLAEVITKLNGFDLNIFMNGNNMISSGISVIDNKVTAKEWIENHKSLLTLIALIVVVIIVLDALWVSYRNRKQVTPFNTNAQFYDNNAKHLRNVLEQPEEGEHANDGNNYHGCLVLLLCATIAFAGVAYAVNGSKNQLIRDYIVGKNKDKTGLDISGDKVIDVLDLVEEKNVSDYEIIKIQEWNEDFLRNMNLYYIDIYNGKTLTNTYSIPYGKLKHFTFNYDKEINAMQCDSGIIENFKAKDENYYYTYDFDYTNNNQEGVDNCYIQYVSN